MKNEFRNIVVMGGGAAGIMAAGAAAEHGANVMLIEKNSILGKKLLLTGGSRCNITNTADIAGFLDKVLRNPNFLYSSLYGFDSEALRNFLHSRGLSTKVEDAGRVFPASDDAVDVFKVLAQYLDNVGVELLMGTAVADIILHETSNFTVMLEDGRKIAADARARS